MSGSESTLVTTAPAPATRRRPARRTLALLGLLAGVVVVAVVLFASGVFGGGGGGGGGGTADNAFPTAVARVMRQSLSSQTQVSATLTYAGASSVVVPAGTPP